MDFTGKNVVFVGGLGGIGYEACKNLVKKSIAYLAILDPIENPKAVQDLEKLNPECRIQYIKFDVTNNVEIKSAISTIVAEVKYIDILVNGAGVLLEQNIQLTIGVNLTGLINTTFEALPYMDKRQHGRGGLILNVASVLGLEPSPVAVVYSATKFGVIGFTRSLGDTYNFDITGVAVTALCPGVTETPLKNEITKRYSFDYSEPLAVAFSKVKSQSAAQCGAHLARVIEINKNNSIWISDCSTLTEVEPKVFWVPEIPKN